MAKNLPGSIPSNTLGVLGDIFQKVASGVFSHLELERFAQRLNPFEIKMEKDSQLISWCVLIKDLFGIKINTSSLKIPEPQPGFDRLIVVPKGITLNQIIVACRERFGDVYCCYDDLDRTVVQNDRTNSQTYAIWVRERIEADEELKNLSANQLQKQNVPGITLMERLLQELKYFSETKKHLDLKNITLCAGSRYSDGSVPGVGWSVDGRGLAVDWYGPDGRYGGLRARAAVS